CSLRQFCLSFLGYSQTMVGTVENRRHQKSMTAQRRLRRQRRRIVHGRQRRFHAARFDIDGQVNRRAVGIERMAGGNSSKRRPRHRT
ncbi:hypothetical protein, partial [Paraburkholderia aspalathi]|uniref:hypothetical protein n=1 Tax=Paraburkholderia aspalathi TaxID=1324617 RepID=UPI0038BA51D0